MPVPSLITDLSTTASSNSPAGSETPAEGDNYIRALSAFIASLRDKLNGTAATGTVKDATFSGTMAGAAAWASLQTFMVGLNVGNSAQAGANTLDWYQEGTFTPVVEGSTSAGTGTYTNQVGRYTRIGNRVFVTVDVRWSSHTGTGTPILASLPFTAANAYNQLHGTHYYAGTATKPAYSYMNTGAAKTTAVQTYVAASDTYTGVTIQAGDAVLALSGHYDV